jgi:hypothetical protein
MGGYQSWGMARVKKTGSTFCMKLTYKVWDYYNWDAGKQAPFPLPAELVDVARKLFGGNGPVRVEGTNLWVEDNVLDDFRRMGLAKTFYLKGEIIREYIWQQGEVPIEIRPAKSVGGGR